MKALILAAGRGSRLKSITDFIPKCLVSVGKKTIIHNMLEHLQKIGVTETIIVVGYFDKSVKAAVGDSFHRMKIRYVENDIYHSTGTSYSLWKGLSEIKCDSDILLIEGDVFFEFELLNDFLLNTNHKETSTIVEKYRAGLDGSFVNVNKFGYVTEWLHKDMRIENHSIKEMYKTINIHKFKSEFISDILFPLLNEFVENKMISLSLERIMHEIVFIKKKNIFAFQNNNKKWVEIDDVNDLNEAKQLFLESSAVEEMKMAELS